MHLMTSDYGTRFTNMWIFSVLCIWQTILYESQQGMPCMASTLVLSCTWNTFPIATGMDYLSSIHCFNDNKSTRHAALILCCHFQQSPCTEDRFCKSRKGGTRDDGWAHPRGANSMAVSELSFRRALVGIGWCFSPCVHNCAYRKHSFAF